MALSCVVLLALGVAVLLWMDRADSDGDTAASQHATGAREFAVVPTISTSELADLESLAGGEARHRAAAPPLPVQFAVGEANAIHGGTGSVRLRLLSGGQLEVPIAGGVALRPPELDADSHMLVLEVTLDRAVHTFLDLDATWRTLAEASPVIVVLGTPVLARVFEPGGDEARTPLRLSPSTVGGMRVAGGRYDDIEATVDSPIALPGRQDGGTLDVASGQGFARVSVPDHCLLPGADLEFLDVHLRPLGSLDVVVHAKGRLDRLTFVLSPVAADWRGSAHLGSHTAPLLSSDWQPGPHGWQVRRSFSRVLAGRYRADLLEVSNQAGLLVIPSEVLLDPSALDADGSEPGVFEPGVFEPGVSEPRVFETRVFETQQFWIDGGDTAEAVAAEIWIHLPLEVEALGNLVGGPVTVYLRALAGGQLLDGQPPLLSFLLEKLPRADHSNRVLIVRRDPGLSAGPYELSVRPLGFVQQVEIQPGEEAVSVTLPPLSEVELRLGDESTASPASMVLPLILTIEPQPAVGRPSPAEAIGSGPGNARYVLAYGDYSLASFGSPQLWLPDRVRVDSPTTTVILEPQQSYSRLVTWSVAGEPIPLPFQALVGSQLLRGESPEENAKIVAHGFDLALGTVGGLEVTVSSPGTFVLILELELPGLGRVTRRLDPLDIAGGSPVPIVMPLDQ